MIWC